MCCQPSSLQGFEGCFFLWDIKTIISGCSPDRFVMLYLCSVCRVRGTGKPKTVTPTADKFEFNFDCLTEKLNAGDVPHTDCVRYGLSFCVSAVKPMQKYPKAALFLLVSRRRLHWFQAEVQLYVHLWAIFSFDLTVSKLGYGLNR